VSLKPRKTPCVAKDTTTAGAPNARSVKYCCAGSHMFESCASKFNNEHELFQQLQKNLLKSPYITRAKYWQSLLLNTTQHLFGHLQWILP
jgi:hypothetical protein